LYFNLPQFFAPPQLLQTHTPTPPTHTHTHSDLGFFLKPGGGVGRDQPRGGGVGGTLPGDAKIKGQFFPRRKKTPKIVFFLAFGRTQRGRTHPPPRPGGGGDLKKKPAPAHKHTHTTTITVGMTGGRGQTSPLTYIQRNRKAKMARLGCEKVIGSRLRFQVNNGTSRSRIKICKI